MAVVVTVFVVVVVGLVVMVGVVVVVVIVGRVAASLHDFSTRCCNTLLSSLKSVAKKKYSGIDAIIRNSSRSTLRVHKRIPEIVYSDPS